MKIRVTLKDPDTMHDAVDDALKREPKPEGISDKEWQYLRDERAETIQSAITTHFMRYGEYLTVDFVIDDAGFPEPPRVVPNSELRD